jgi:hypothetical protein
MCVSLPYAWLAVSVHGWVLRVLAQLTQGMGHWSHSRWHLVLLRCESWAALVVWFGLDGARLCQSMSESLRTARLAR